jgi:hypothetical protein
VGRLEVGLAGVAELVDQLEQPHHLVAPIGVADGDGSLGQRLAGTVVDQAGAGAEHRRHQVAERAVVLELDSQVEPLAAGGGQCRQGTFEVARRRAQQRQAVDGQQLVEVGGVGVEHPSAGPQAHQGDAGPRIPSSQRPQRGDRADHVAQCRQGAQDSDAFDPVESFLSCNGAQWRRVAHCGRR